MNDKSKKYTEAGVGIRAEKQWNSKKERVRFKPLHWSENLNKVV